MTVAGSSTFRARAVRAGQALDAGWIDRGELERARHALAQPQAPAQEESA